MASIYPSLFTSDLLNLGRTISTFDPHCPGYHLDLMDAHFVPNLSFGVDAVHAIAQATQRDLHIHLMVEKPSQIIDQIGNLKESDIILFHIESNCDIAKTINLIHKKNTRVGIAISPKTPVNKLFPYLGLIDQALLMSVEPGFSGQPFLETATDRLKSLVAERTAKKLPFKIAMDGGINQTNIQTLVDSGLDVCAIGSGIFGHPDPLATFLALQKMIA